MNNRRPPSIFNAGAARFAPVGQSVTRPKAPKAQSPKAPRPQGPKARRPRGPAGSAGSQCLRPHGDARPPHEQGAGALRFGSDGAAVGADGGRPTSRGLPPATRWATLPCPGGQGVLPVCVFDAVCPAGKGASELALRILACRGKKQGFGTFRPSRDFPGAPGDGGTDFSPQGAEFFPHAVTLRSHNEPLPARNGDTPHLTVKTRPSSHKTFHIYPSVANAARNKPRLIAPAFRGEHPACVQPQFPALPVTASSPNHPAGRTAGSARTRSRVQTLENPFWGTAHVFPRLPSPKTPQAAGPCSWACRRLFPPPPHSERNEASPPPAHGADLRDPRAEGTGRRHCRLHHLEEHALQILRLRRGGEDGMIVGLRAVFHHAHVLFRVPRRLVDHVLKHLRGNVLRT